MIPTKTIDMARIQAKTSGTKVNIYRLESGTYVIAPVGYTIPDKVILVGYVESNGNFTQTNTDRIQESD